MPKQPKKDELGRLGKTQKKTPIHTNSLLKAIEVETRVSKGLAARQAAGSPSASNPAPDAAQGTEAGLAKLQLKVCTALLSAVIIHLVAGLGSKSDLLCTDKNNISESQDDPVS